MVCHEVIADTQEREQLAVAVQHGIEQGAVLGFHVAQPRHLPVKHVEEAGKQNKGPAPAHEAQIVAVAFFAAHDEEHGHAHVQHQANDGHGVGGEA